MKWCVWWGQTVRQVNHRKIRKERQMKWRRTQGTVSNFTCPESTFWHLQMSQIRGAFLWQLYDQLLSYFSEEPSSHLSRVLFRKQGPGRYAACPRRLLLPHSCSKWSCGCCLDTSMCSSSKRCTLIAKALVLIQHGAVSPASPYLSLSDMKSPKSYYPQYVYLIRPPIESHFTVANLLPHGKTFAN